MILNEKRLIKVMAGRCKEDGYSVAAFYVGGDAYLGIRSGGWAVVCEWSNVPRKVLATIVEHAGSLPMAGQAWLLEKDMEPQTEEFAVAADEFRALMACAEDAELERMRRTTLHMGTYRLWQSEKDGKIWKVSPALTAMATAGASRITAAGVCLCMSGNVSAVFVDRAAVPEAEEKPIGHLEKMRWA